MIILNINIADQPECFSIQILSAFAWLSWHPRHWCFPLRTILRDKQEALPVGLGRIILATCLQVIWCLLIWWVAAGISLFISRKLFGEGKGMISIPYEIVANWPGNNVLWVQMSYQLYWVSRELSMWYKNKKNHKEHTGLFHTRGLIIFLSQVTILELR